MGHYLGMKNSNSAKKIGWLGNLTALQLDELLFHIFENLKKKTPEQRK